MVIRVINTGLTVSHPIGVTIYPTRPVHSHSPSGTQFDVLVIHFTVNV